MENLLLPIRAQRKALINLLVFMIILTGTAQYSYGQDAPGADHLNSAIETTDGAYLLLGASDSPAGGNKTEPSKGGNDFWIVKTGAWDKTFGGEGEDSPYTAIQTADGGFLLVGISNSGISGNKTAPNRGDYDCWLIKIDGQGNKLWDKTFGGDQADDLSSIVPTPDGGYLLAGSSFSGKTGDKSEESRGNNDFWIVKIDAAGNKLWDKTFGGNGVDDLSSVVSNPDGGFLLAGTSDSSLSGDKSEEGRSFDFGEYISYYADYWVVKIDAAGNKLWDKTYSRSECCAIYYNNYLVSIIADKNGGYLLAGWSNIEDILFAGGRVNNGDPFGSDYWVVKITSAGGVLWEATYTILPCCDPNGRASYSYLSFAFATQDGGYFLGGNGNNINYEFENPYTQAYYVVKIAPDEYILPNPIQINFQNRYTKTPQGWIKDYGLPFSEKQIADSTLNFGWKKRSDGIPVDLSIGGPFPGNGRWRPAPADPLLATLMHMQGDDVKNFRGTPVESYWEMAVENGDYQVTISVGDGTRYTFTDPESHSLNIEGIPAITNFTSQASNGSLARFSRATINVTVEDGLLTIDADGGTNTKINYAIIQPLSSATAMKAYFAPQESEMQVQVKAYPNPFTTGINLTMQGLQGNVDISLYDVTGHTLYQVRQQNTGPTLFVDLSAAHLKPGMYLLRLTAEDGSSKSLKVWKR